MKKTYDYIITGAGCAGLSLAYRLAQGGFEDKQILIIDKDQKDSDDRTWCFWEAEENIFESIVTKKWEKLFFHSNYHEQLMDIAPFKYKMIRGIDFYRFTLEAIKKCDNIEIVLAEIESIEDTASGANVKTSIGDFQSHLVFNSVVFFDLKKERSNYIDQHFKGWIIETETTTFDPAKATLMDFRIAQEGETRFVYILPTHENRAMIEATIFSNQILPQSQYDQIIKDYIQQYTSIGNYKILHEEFGIIPMTDFPFKSFSGKNIIQIGTAGGLVKPSSGYAFIRIQERSDLIVEALKNNAINKLPKSGQSKRYRLYDSILINVMLNKRVSIDQVFSDLFSKNKPAKVLQFLNEKTSFVEEFFIMNTCPKVPFIKGFVQEFGKRLVT